jgi:hypothetical protein
MVQFVMLLHHCGLLYIRMRAEDYPRDELLSLLNQATLTILDQEVEIDKLKDLNKRLVWFKSTINRFAYGAYQKPNKLKSKLNPPRR